MLAMGEEAFWLRSGAGKAGGGGRGRGGGGSLEM